MCMRATHSRISLRVLTSNRDEVITAQIVTDAEAFIEYSNKNNVPITKELIHEIISKEIKEVNKELPVHKQIRKFHIREKEFEKTTTQKILDNHP
jgi:long-chain acyl-CoA synthetase